jgi:hypothetical protein
LLDPDGDTGEFACGAGAEELLRVAAVDGWTVVSGNDDRVTVFAR